MFKKEINEIKNYADINNIPIMNDKGLKYLLNFIEEHDIKTILEVGTAIGYSAIMMCLASSNIKVVTIERDETRYLEAIKNIKKFNLENRITLIFNDALEVKLNDKFDLIFLDGAKGKNIEFFEHFEKNLNPLGYFITDNIYFHGYVEMEEIKIDSKNLRSLVRKIKNYIEYLKNNENYDTLFVSDGDGLAITTRKRENDEDNNNS